MSAETVTERTRILAVDDDPGILNLVSHILRRAGYDVAVAADGAEGLRRIGERAPDLVLCDVQMPVMDGFAALESVRANAATAALPFVLLTALDNRENVRRGMRLGADDFLTKPVRADELTESVKAALDKRRRLGAMVSEHALQGDEELRRRYERELATSQPRALPEPALGAITGRMLTQTVLFTDIRGFTSISERLPATEIAELLSRYLQEACKPILQERGRIMKIMGDGLMAIFGSEAPGDLRAHARGALRAGIGILDAAREFGAWVGERFDLSGLPAFEVGVGIHTGELLLFQLSAGGVGDLTAVGDTVNVAARLETKSKELGWPLVASMAAIEAAGPGFDVAETREIEVAGREARIRVGLLRTPSALTPRPGGPLALTPGIRAVLDENARATAEAAKAAIDSTLHAVGAQFGRSATAPAREPVVRGYRVLERIGEGGMSTVYLAEETARGRKAVLKILKGCRGDDESLWKRFFQECAIVSAIDHEHVVRIYDQGFGDEMAYIAMEHLCGGSLREVIDRGLSPRQALSLASQAASGLAAIHARDIVHRDIKPANLLLRDSGVLVLTDFGVAKRLDQSAGQTSHGEILGTPYYIAPEQAAGGTITPRADLYSLGVIFYEMLTGRRPFSGATVQEILAQHAMAPVPRLPAALAGCQPVIDGMLAKRPEERFESAEAVLAAIDEAWTKSAARTAD
jgi:CheY-like chemotaxis protein/tRNA A-37 threonylcarbamoyl transferase component Bud32